jgi:uncharacterized protein (DUF885 family)
MNKFFKWTGIVLASLLVVVMAVGTWAWNAHLPNFNWAVNRAFLKMVIDSPETLSQMRLLEPMGITFHQDDLDDESPAAGDRALEKMKAIMADLKSYDRSELNEQDRLSYDIASWLMQRMEEGSDRWRYYNYPVNQLFGVQSNFPSFMDSAHAISDEGDAEDYIARLSKTGWKFDGVLESLKVREEQGILPPRFVVERVLKEMSDFVATPPEENILYTSLAKKLDKADIDADDKADILAAAGTEIQRSVYPAYQKLIDYFTALKPKTTEDAGVWKFPHGDEFYAFMLQMMTTTDLTPDEIHSLGLQEVDRLQAEMREILTAQGYDPEVPVGELMARLNEEPRFLYPDTDEGRAQILADYQAIIDEISAGLDPWFGMKPKATVEVRRVPEFKEKTSPGAYYQGPAMDGSRPGVFYANLYDIKATPKFNMRTLAYHEAVPGHHFQVSLAQEQKALPLFRRMGGFPAYSEGWALYAERLAWEAGFEKDPFDNLGRLQAELFRAVRLVVDTGIHAKRWTREQAIDYMRKTTGMAESDVVSEVERYIVMPGQACSYKVGMLKILELRERARQALGDAFDIREFHDQVLGNGPMPLAILEQVIDQWIARKQEQANAA